MGIEISTVFRFYQIIVTPIVPWSLLGWGQCNGRQNPKLLSLISLPNMVIFSISLPIRSASTPSALPSLPPSLPPSRKKVFHKKGQKLLPFINSSQSHTRFESKQTVLI